MALPPWIARAGIARVGTGLDGLRVTPFHPNPALLTMNLTNPMRQYHAQALLSATPEQLIAKLYDLGIQACHQDNRQKLRAVLKELISSLDFEAGGELARALFNLYEYCINLSIDGDLGQVSEVLSELRDVWKSATIDRKAA